MNTPAEKILFILNQVRDAEAVGFPRNLVNRNLRLAITHYWGYEVLGFSTIRKATVPRSYAARNLSPAESIYEHAVPLTVLMYELLKPRYDTPRKVANHLGRLYRVCLVTHEENQWLRSVGLNSRMPEGWDGNDPWARYRAAGIRFNEAAVERAHSIRT
jgi:hypothetical protein